MQAERAQIKNIDPLINQMIHFRRVILGLETPLVSGVEGTKSLEVIDAIQRAAVSQELVQLCVSPDGTDVSDGSTLTEVVTSSQ